MANIITGIRIVISIVLLFCPVLSQVFFVLYIVTGGLLFIFPLTLVFVDLKYSAIVVCVVATIAAIHEGYLVYMGRAT